MIRDEASRGIFKNSSAFLCDPRRNDYIIKQEISRNKQEDDNKAMQKRKVKNVSQIARKHELRNPVSVDGNGLKESVNRIKNFVSKNSCNRRCKLSSVPN